jgi:hypothetical protein
MGKADGLERVVEQARKDPEFFHQLVWKTEEIVADLDYLSRREKSALLGVDPEDLIAGLATGRLRPGDVVAECGGTCGASCGGSCGASCGGSCTVTCVGSCPATGLRPGEREEVINPADQVSAAELGRQIREGIRVESFTRFER